MSPISADLIGYCDRFDYRPGDIITVHAQGDAMASLEVTDLPPPYGKQIAQLVPGIARLERRLRRQSTYPGSFALIEAAGAASAPTGLTLSAWLYPTRLASTEPQGIVAALSSGGA